MSEIQNFTIVLSTKYKDALSYRYHFVINRYNKSVTVKNFDGQTFKCRHEAVFTLANHRRIGIFFNKLKTDDAEDSLQTFLKI